MPNKKTSQALCIQTVIGCHSKPRFIPILFPICPTTADPAVPWNVNCSTPNVDLDNRLSLFSQWRGAKGNDSAGLWHLMSNCPTGSQVGIAWLGTLCRVNTTTSGSAIVSGAAVSTAGLTEWQVISHEIGHNFGAIVRSFRLETGVFSDKSAYGECPFSMM